MAADKSTPIAADGIAGRELRRKRGIPFDNGIGTLHRSSAAIGVLLSAAICASRLSLL
jgi:hypothetical protein